jgi:pimeloyl-ACP methyl ester carboxylesterase
LAFSWSSAHAEGAQFKFLKTVKISELNAMLNAERTAFLAGATEGDGYVLPPPSKATNAVDLYTVRYYSKSPELNDREMLASGLLAIPSGTVNRKLPLIAYMHGTVFGKYEVPSFAFRQQNPSGEPHYDQAYETRYMVALFAGNGYAVMAPDYFGLGAGALENDAYMMKQSTAQGAFDLYRDVKGFLATKDIAPSHVFVSGWSQGGLNTTGFLELLEQKGVNVRAAFTAASPNDPYAMLNAVAFHPRAADAPWMSAILGLSAFSCENYMGPEGLAREIINPKYYADMKKIYDKTLGGPLALYQLLVKWQQEQLTFVDFFRSTYRNPTALATSAYGECMGLSETYRREFKTPLRMYYGSSDEVIRPLIGLLGADYQQRITDSPDAPPSSKIKAFEVEGAGHRRTFISGAVAAKSWMDGMH